jgi:hypothetical protein
MKLALQEAARIWCSKETSSKTMDAVLCKEIAKVIKQKNDLIEQLRVQLAGCGVAALGYCRKGKKNNCKKGSYGWSDSLCDVQNLYEKYIKLCQKNNKDSNDNK